MTRMRQTDLEQALIDLLKLTNLSKANRGIVFLQLDGDRQILRMCEYLLENEQATDEQILSEAKRISKQ